MEQLVTKVPPPEAAVRTSTFPVHVLASGSVAVTVNSGVVSFVYTAFDPPGGVYVYPSLNPGADDVAGARLYVTDRYGGWAPSWESNRFQP